MVLFWQDVLKETWKKGQTPLHTVRVVFFLSKQVNQSKMENGQRREGSISIDFKICP